MSPFDPMEKYDRNCAAFDHPDRLPAWQALRGVLEGRTGWRFDLGDSGVEPLWLFGLEGAGRLVAYATGPEHIHLFDHDNDADHMFCGPAEFRSWLDEHEAEHAGYTETQVELGTWLLREEIDRGVLLPGEEGQPPQAQA